ncbi:insecticidal delta-endotoxin Cry8Ea1 family protein [Bacillus thuringiensis]
MKYKDRKHAKRKYKQALLATVATMTLGVSTLGSTASAFAEEKNTEAQQEQAPTDSLGAGGGAISENSGLVTNPLAQYDKKIQDLMKNSGATNYKTSLSAVEKLIPAIYKDIKKGDYINTIKTLSMFSASLIPYGGSFISPILSLLFDRGDDASIDTKLATLANQLRTEMDEKIIGYDKETLQAKIKPLLENLTVFEDKIQGTHFADILLKKDSVDEYNAEDLRMRARLVDDGFNKLISETDKDSYKDSELPIYTLAATSHLEFLQFIKTNGMKPEIALPKDVWEDYVKELERKTKEYKQHIEKTYESGVQKIQKQIDEKTSGKDENQYIKDLNKKIADLNADHTRWQNNTDYMQNQLDKLESQKTVVRNLVDSKTKYIGSTVNSVAFNASTPASWQKKDDNASTGNLMKDLAIAPTTKPDGNSLKYYYIDEYNVPKTRWVLDKEGNYYYLSPKDGTKNDAGETFKKGQMMTGWFKDLDNTWYYFNDKGVWTK